MSGPVFATGGVEVTHSCGHLCFCMMTSADNMSQADFIKMNSAKLCPTCESEQKKPSPKAIHVVVDRHPSGNHTLKYRFSKTQMFEDYKGSLFCNNDKEVFYRSVAKKIAELSQEGLQVFYEDVSN